MKSLPSTDMCSISQDASVLSLLDEVPMEITDNKQEGQGLDMHGVKQSYGYIAVFYVYCAETMTVSPQLDVRSIGIQCNICITIVST